VGIGVVVPWRVGEWREDSVAASSAEREGFTTAVVSASVDDIEVVAAVWGQAAAAAAATSDSSWLDRSDSSFVGKDDEEEEDVVVDSIGVEAVATTILLFSGMLLLFWGTTRNADFDVNSFGERGATFNDDEDSNLEEHSSNGDRGDALSRNLVKDKRGDCSFGSSSMNLLLTAVVLFFGVAIFGDSFMGYGSPRIMMLLLLLLWAVVFMLATCGCCCCCCCCFCC
jgi:hypothetical protein